MNLINKIKKSAPPAATSVPAISNHPADDICDLETLAAMLQQLQARNQQYQRAIDALIAARRIVNGWDPKPEPELVWSVRRDVLAAMGDQEALAQFDREHVQDIAAEQAARQAANQQALEAPARVKALEQYITDLAAEMVRDVDEGFIFEEMKRIFRPSAQRMLTTARAFVQAWREMKTVEMSLKSAFRLTHYSIQGDRRTGYDLTLIGKRSDDDLLPNLIEGLAYEDLVDLNQAFNGRDSELSRQISQRLDEAGVPSGLLRVYHPGAIQRRAADLRPGPEPAAQASAGGSLRRGHRGDDPDLTVWTPSDSAIGTAAKPGFGLGFCPPQRVHAPVSTTGRSTMTDTPTKGTVSSASRGVAIDADGRALDTLGRALSPAASPPQPQLRGVPSRIPHPGEGLRRAAHSRSAGCWSTPEPSTRRSRPPPGAARRPC